MNTDSGGRGWLAVALAIILLGAALLWMNRYQFGKLGSRPVRTNRFTGTTEALGIYGWELLEKQPSAAPQPTREPAADPTPDPRAGWRRAAQAAKDLEVPVGERAQVHTNVMFDRDHNDSYVQVQNASEWVVTQLTVLVHTRKDGVWREGKPYRLSMWLEPGETMLVPVVLDIGQMSSFDRGESEVIAAKGRYVAREGE